MIAPTVDLVPIIDILNPHLALMLGALQWEMITYAALFTCYRSRCGDHGAIHDINHFSPRPRFTSKESGIAKEVESTFGSRQSHTGTIVVRKEADRMALVRSNER